MDAQTYNIHNYDVPLTTIDVAIFTVLYGHLHVLLVKRAGEENDPHNGKWSLPGGFIDLKVDRNLDEAAKRKLKEKTGVHAPYLEKVDAIGDSERDWRGWSITILFFALLPNDKVQLRTGKGANDVKWVPVDDKSLKGSLAFDHNKLLSMAVDRLREKVKYTTLPVYLMPKEFSLPALQAIYEIILDTKLEAKSFRRRIDASGVVEEISGGPVQIGKGRPSQLYRAVSNEPHYFIRNISGTRDAG